MTLSLQLVINYWSIYHETWYVDRTWYGVMHICRIFWSRHFCAPWNLENIRKSTNNLIFLCQLFINEITASDAGPVIIRSHLSSHVSIRNCVCLDRRLSWKFTRHNVGVLCSYLPPRLIKVFYFRFLFTMPSMPLLNGFLAYQAAIFFCG